MASQPFLWLRGRTYHFRRRVPFGSSVTNPISISMKTRDPDRACILARRLAARWDAETMYASSTSHLTLQQRTQIFRDALADELALATAHTMDGTVLDRTQEERRAKIYSAAYRDTAARIAANGNAAAPDHLDGLTATEADTAHLFRRMFADQDALTAGARDLLGTLGLPCAPALIRDVILARLAGMIEAQDRSALITRPEVASAFDGVAKLVDDQFVAAVKAGMGEFAHPAGSAPTAQPVASPATQCHTAEGPSRERGELVEGNPLFANRDERRFSEVIDHIIATKRQSSEWSVDHGDQKRLLTVFAWLTDDKRLCDYTQADINEFKAAYDATPSGFPWAKYLNATPRPRWSDVKATIKGPVKRRNAKTFNRDVGVVHGACTVLAQSAWKPIEGEEPVLKIGKRSTVPETADELDLRAPWSEIELRTLYNLPLYTGNGGHLKRLVTCAEPRTWHDAAYWLPLLATYSGACREELAGLELEDVDVDCEVPYIFIRNNLTRSKDGITPGGQKAPSRRRYLPLHSELLRLGFAEYARAIKAEGHSKLFPELYLVKTGGGRFFYPRAWEHIVKAVDAITPLQRNYLDKAADFHSLRTYSGSVLADIEVKQDAIDQILGHKSKSMHAKHYKKLMRVRGIQYVLQQLRTIIERQFIVVTGHLQPAPVDLLPLKHRSRTGSVPSVRMANLAEKNQT